MRVIKAKNVNVALNEGIALIKDSGVDTASRVGMTLEIPEPVTTVYEKPWERVLISRARDANPFFHMMESLWIIAGRQDVKFLTEFNKRMADYSDDGLVFNAPYGYRLRNYFPIEYDTAYGVDRDQIEPVVDILRNDPKTRQAVCQIWDTDDLKKQTRDKACNMILVFRIREDKLDMTVYNRSNDMIWGAYGANAVHFSMIQEYVSAKVGISMGKYYQVSNAFHVYTDGPGGKVWNRIKDEHFEDPYEREDVKTLVLMGNCPKEVWAFDNDLHHFFDNYDRGGLSYLYHTSLWESKYFALLVVPILRTFYAYKENNLTESRYQLSHIFADDWRIACQNWITTRVERKVAKNQTERNT